MKEPTVTAVGFESYKFMLNGFSQCKCQDEYGSFQSDVRLKDRHRLL